MICFIAICISSQGDLTFDRKRSKILLEEELSLKWEANTASLGWAFLGVNPFIWNRSLPFCVMWWFCISVAVVTQRMKGTLHTKLFIPQKIGNWRRIQNVFPGQEPLKSLSPMMVDEKHHVKSFRKRKGRKVKYM